MESFWNVFNEITHPMLQGISMCYKCLSFFRTKGSTSSLNNHMKSQCMSDITSGIRLEDARQNYMHDHENESNKTSLQRKITDIFKSDNGKQFNEKGQMDLCKLSSILINGV